MDNIVSTAIQDSSHGKPDENATLAARVVRVLRWLLTRALRLIVIFAAVLLLLRVIGCAEQLFYHPIAERTPAPRYAEDVWFESADGTRLFGWWIPAVSQIVDDPAAVPTIIHVHGNAGNIASHEFFSSHLPKAGFNVFLFDYRGYGQSDGWARKRADLIADAHAALDYVLTRDGVDTNRIAVYGQSLGGAIGINLMAARQEIEAGVFESSFDSWRTVAANAVGGDPPNIIGRALSSILIADHHAPRDVIGSIERPMLFLHGDSDTIVPHSHSQRLAELSGEYATLMLFEDGEHNSLKQTHPEMKQAMIEFLLEMFE